MRHSFFQKQTGSLIAAVLELHPIHHLADKMDAESARADIGQISGMNFRQVQFLSVIAQHDVEDIVFDFQSTPRNAPIREFFAKFLGCEPVDVIRLSKGTFVDRCPRLFYQVKELSHA